MLETESRVSVFEELLQVSYVATCCQRESGEIEVFLAGECQVHFHKKMTFTTGGV